jgi:hypothetical protein
LPKEGTTNDDDDDNNNDDKPDIRDMLNNIASGKSSSGRSNKAANQKAAELLTMSDRDLEEKTQTVCLCVCVLFNGF